MHTPVSLTPMNIHTLTVRNRFVLPGMVTVMVPDLVQDSGLIDGILDGKAESLLEVAQWMEGES